MAEHASRPILADASADLCEEDRLALESAFVDIASSAIPAACAFVSLSQDDAAACVARRTAAGEKVLALAGRAHVDARRAARKAGAFDFLTTGPIQPAELAARIQLVQTGSALPKGIAIKDQHLLLNDQSHELTVREVEILSLLIEAKGRFVTHERLLALWGRHASELQYLRVAIRKLRRRIEPEPDLPRFLLIEAAIGYRMGNGGG